MTKQTKTNESSPESEQSNIQMQTAVAKTLHDEVVALATGVSALSLEMSRAVATLEAAGREVAEHQQAGGVHLAAYQRNLLGGEKIAADASLAEVGKSREQTAKAAAHVRNHAQTVEDLGARCNSLYAEGIRLVPLAEAAVILAKQDASTVSVMLTATSAQGSKLRKDVANVLAALPRDGDV